MSKQKYDLTHLDLDAEIEKLFKEKFETVPRETGWKILIHGEWVVKSNRNGNRLYASFAAAKKNFEDQVFYELQAALEKPHVEPHILSEKGAPNSDRWSNEYREWRYKNEKKIKELEKLDDERWERMLNLNNQAMRVARKFLNSLYESGVVTFEEVK